MRFIRKSSERPAAEIGPWLLVLAVLLSCLAGLSYADALLVKNAEVFDVDTGAPFSADVLVENGRFSRIGRNLDDLPTDTKIIDATGLSLLPGLVDVHTHWTAMGGATRASTARDLVLAGVTTATDFHAAPEAFSALRAHHASMLSPHVFFAARVGVPWGHGTAWTDQRVTRTVFDATEASAAVTDLLRYAPDAIKVFADGWRYGTGKNLNSINIDALKAIVATAGKADVAVFSHTVTVEGGKLAARAGVKAIVHAIQDAPADAELVNLLRENRVFYSPTLTVYEPHAEEMAAMHPHEVAIVRQRQDMSKFNLAAFNAAGIPIAMGTDQGIDNNPFGIASLREVELLVEFGGLDPSQALVAATINSAALLGLEQDRGSVSVGKRGDFLLVRGKPWQTIGDLRNIHHVYVDGRQVVRSGEFVGPPGPEHPPARPATRLIDDFAHPELTAAGARRGISVDHGHPRSSLMLSATRSSLFGPTLFLAAELAAREQPYAFAVLPLSPGGVVPRTTSCFKGVRFDARGSGVYQVGLVMPDARAEAGFTASANWQANEIPFSEFQHESTQTDRDGPVLTEIQIGRRGEFSEQFWLELANVSFYGCAAAADATSPGTDAPGAIEGVSLLGAPLFRRTQDDQVKVDSTSVLQQLDSTSALAEADYTALGNALASAGRYSDAIRAFGLGIQHYPDSYRLRRHRAHRYLTTRQLQLAGKDLQAARHAIERQATEGKQQALQSDTTYRHWITYHLGIYHYLNRDFSAAAETFEQCLETAGTNDMLLGTVDWLYSALMRAGNPRRASEVLGLVAPDIEADRSYPYFKRVMFYKGLVSAESIIDLSAPETWTARDATIAYAIANNAIISNNTETASEILQNIVETPFWNIWAYILAEKDLAVVSRLR